jgi:hypothetical protein
MFKGLVEVWVIAEELKGNLLSLYINSNYSGGDQSPSLSISNSSNHASRREMPKKRCETKEELIEAIEISMNKVSIQECEKAVNSFWTRCRTVENAKGAY